MPGTNNHIEKKLIVKLRKGESRAFDEIFNLYSRRVYLFAYSFLKNKQDSEGIVQEVFLRVWKNRKKIDEYYSLKAFLFTISYNLIIEKFRERVKDLKYKKFLEKNAIHFGYETDKKIEYSDLNESYKNVVEHLPERRKTIYKMHRFEGFSYREIAKKLHISTKTVENQMTSALKFIRERLGPETLAVVLFYFLVVS
jgi:RNA polymerase sigma-70 factor (family 1)